MYKGAIRSILSELVRQDRVMVVDAFEIDAPKTKVLLKKLQEMKVEGNVLIVSHAITEELYLAARNLYGVDIRDVATTAADPVALVRADKIIVTEAAIKEVEGLLK